RFHHYSRRGRRTKRVGQVKPALHVESPLPDSLSVAVLTPEAGREAEEELGALELGEPFGDDEGEGVVAGGDDAGGAGGAELLGGQLAVAGEGPIAVAGDLVIVLAQPDDHGDAVAGVDGEGVADFGADVAVEETEVDHRRGAGEMIENRALVDTVAAPGAV